MKFTTIEFRVPG